MDQASNKTIMCSVFFLDIVGYSKRSVAGQISLKERFNGYLSAAIRDVPLSDRIILDTGDGAAINFMGDLEDALKAALSMRASMLHEDPNMEPPLLVRMGVNLGPVRLIRDLNGLPNIVGDGINVAQRVMGFADASQILVSRSYYDAVSRLSPKYAGMFHYQGARTDKHVREHEVYAIGYPGDKTTRPFAVHDGAGQPPTRFDKWLAIAANRIKQMQQPLDPWLNKARHYYQNIDPRTRPIYIALLGIPCVLLLVFGLKAMARHEVINKQQIAAARIAKVAPAVAISAPLASSAVAVISDAQIADAVRAELARQAALKPVKPEQRRSEPVYVIKRPAPLTTQEQAELAANVKTSRLFGFANHGEDTGKAVIAVSCQRGTLVFVDGAQKGRLSSRQMDLEVSVGKHVVIIILPNQKLFTHTLVAQANKKIELNPAICN
ncbi:MAG: adenylate/guanylate cyclase domain-containing protein [Sideroxydans sp.]|nr:adenylate/guanylate cyclase domain-containing protein [Sideroxydans sp.]